MSHESDAPPPRGPRHAPGEYSSRHPAITEATMRDDEPTGRTRSLKERLSAEDWEIVERLSVRRSHAPPASPSDPPAKKLVVSALTTIVAALVFAIISGAVATYVGIQVNKGVSEANQEATSRWIASLDAQVHEHITPHRAAPETLAALAKLSAQIDSNTSRIDRIEHQLDAQRTARLR